MHKFLLSASLLALACQSGLAKPFDRTPEATLTGIVQAWNAKDLKGVARRVVGARPNPDHMSFLQDVGREWPRLTVDRPQVQRNGATATLSYTISMATGQRTERQLDKVTMRLEGGNWKVVPVASMAKAERPPIVGTLAYMVANPGAMVEARKAAKSTVCLSNLKQVALGFMMFAADNDDKLSLTASSMRSKVSPYLKNEALWKCPENPGKASYSFNSNLAGKSLAHVSRPAETVLLYEGQSGKPTFRHDGRAAIAFADGHARLLTPEQAKSLRWKP
jgi:prepilin-type processing-associated H-X9-DG protein